jgi:hypothetical protein
MNPLTKIRAYLDEKRLDRWIVPFVKQKLTHRRPRVFGPRHLLFAFCDHYEPLWGNVDEDVGASRVDLWRQAYPQLAGAYRDADGFAPRHSFFFPGEQYSQRYLEPLAELAAAGYGEVEFHLHHDGDTATALRGDIQRYLKQLAQHGHLSRDADGRLRYAFIHGNWCLANAREDRRLCGVDDEIPLLYETGCYADFTFPSAPDETQPRRINQIYWPVGHLEQRRAYEQGEQARVGKRMRDRILIIEGPLALALRSRANPIRIENAHVTGTDPGSLARVRTWVGQDIHVRGRPEWLFVKVHTHGAPEKTARSLLGAGGHQLHQALTGQFNDGKRYVLHYVTAREMYNIALAAMDGRAGNPNAYRDYVLSPPPVVSGSRPAN